jgi:hypothetical protein
MFYAQTEGGKSYLFRVKILKIIKKVAKLLSNSINSVHNIGYVEICKI